MSETQFTRADWRPGKRRRSTPRVKPWGGAKVAGVAFLAMSGSRAGFGSGKHRRCALAHCNGWAMKGVSTCHKHGGAGNVARYRRPFVRVERSIMRCEGPWGAKDGPPGDEAP
jgi:DnaJ-class molecular chaperone